MSLSCFSRQSAARALPRLLCVLLSTFPYVASAEDGEATLDVITVAGHRDGPVTLASVDQARAEVSTTAGGANVVDAE